jgi:ParB family chromosome partitioning protein
MSENVAVTIPSEYRDLPVSWIVESPNNPRTRFNEATLAELAASIKAQGVLQPLLVRPVNEDTFEVVAGARRLRAARLAEISTVPVRVVQMSDSAALEATVVENLQRENIHPLEEARGLRFILHLVVGSVYKLVFGFSSAIFAVLAA